MAEKSQSYGKIGRPFSPMKLRIFHLHHAGWDAMSSRCFLPAEMNSSPGDSLLFQTAKLRNVDKQTTTKMEEPKFSIKQS